MLARLFCGIDSYWECDAEAWPPSVNFRPESRSMIIGASQARIQAFEV